MPESSLKIKLLNDSLINKIAAGEVIERPASVVKELLENSIDASATNILVELKDGGREFIRIADDGEGMLPGDARLCIARHATSKISHESELFSIKTLGFRGEALASIAAVSRMTIETMRNDSESGIKIDVVCGQIKEEKPIAKNHGTTITVTDLFYNLPVRKKFLKSESSELSKIIDTISQLGMAYPYISFKLFHNNRETLNFPKSQGYKDRIGALLGPKIIHHLIPFSYENEIMSVTGFAGDRETSRSDRRNQYLFVNDRPVFNNSVNFAIKSSYQGYIPESRFPVIVLFIKINFDEVDVNIHPAKRDVRFRNDSKMISVIQSVIKNALHNFNTMPSISMISQQSQEFAYEKYQMPAPDYVSEAAQQNLFPTSSDSSGKEVHENLPLVNYLQLHNTYILCQIKNGLLFIDQHVAHERILFEKAAQDLERPSGA
ncbi:MAG: DNA mismatch repair endonuclease MutL, partial [Elusimicrobiota bacterium]